MEKNKHRGRMIWVDWLLLALAAALLFLGARFISSRRVAAEATVSITYTLCLEGLPYALAEANGSWEKLLPIGAAVANANATAQMGRVSSVEIREHYSMTVQRGEAVTVAVPDTADIYVTVKGYATAREGEGLRMGDIRVAAGERGDYYIGSFYAGNALNIWVERGARDE